MQNLRGYQGFMTDLNVRVFGQAKHRLRNLVTEDEVRVLRTHFEDFNDNIGEAFDFVNSECRWFLENKGLLTPMLMSNKTFTKGADQFAERRRIILREGFQIVEDIIRLAQPETWLRKQDGQYVFVQDILENYLESITEEA